MFHCLENWKGNQVVRSSVNIAINTACEIGKVSPELTAVLNLPFRALGMISSQRKTSVLGGCIETLVLASLFFPYGRYISIAFELGFILSSRRGFGADRDEAPNARPQLQGSVDMNLERMDFDGRVRGAVFSLTSNRYIDDWDAMVGAGVKIVKKYSLFASLREFRSLLETALAVMPQVVEVSDKMFLEQAIKETTKQIQILVKRLPVFGLAVGTLFAIQRISRGQLWRGVAEVASGVAGCFPGYGTMLSIGLDVVIVGLDVRDVRNNKQLSNEKDVNALLEKVPLNVPSAYYILGFGSNVHPEREELQAAHNHFYVIVSKSCLQNLARIESEDEGDAADKEDHQEREELYTQGMQRGFLALQKVQQLLGLDEFVPTAQ